MSRTNISTLKGWTIAKITFSAGWYTMYLEKGERKRIITVDADDVFDGDGMRFNNNLPHQP